MLYPLSYEGRAPTAGAPREIFSRIGAHAPMRCRSSLPGMPPRAVHVTRELFFSTPRSLPHLLGGRKGPHRYRVVLTVAGPVDERGLVVDFAELDRLVEPVLAQLDGADLVELLASPSAEVIAVWLVERLEPLVPGLVSVQVWETERGSAVAYTG